jgi:hypothetical protein
LRDYNTPWYLFEKSGKGDSFKKEYMSIRPLVTAQWSLHCQQHLKGIEMVMTKALLCACSGGIIERDWE